MVMICAFGEHPPVFSKPRTTDVQPPYPTQPQHSSMYYQIVIQVLHKHRTNIIIRILLVTYWCKKF